MSQIKRQRVGEQADEQCLVGVTKHVQGKKKLEIICPGRGCVCSVDSPVVQMVGSTRSRAECVRPDRDSVGRESVLFLGLICTALASVAELYLARQEPSDDRSQSKTQK